MILLEHHRISKHPIAARRISGTHFPKDLIALFRNAAAVPNFVLLIWIVVCIAFNAEASDRIRSAVPEDNKKTSLGYDRHHHRHEQTHSQLWKQRFINFLKERNSLHRILNRRRKSHVLKSSSLDLPIITDPSLTYHLHPTSALLIASERRKLVSSSYIDHNLAEQGADSNSERLDLDEAHYETWFAPEQNAVYATIPDMDDPSHIENQPLQDFYLHRHLSRYERLYRTKHEYDLQYKWNGYYDGKFLNQIVLFEDSASRIMNCSYHCNMTSSGSRQPLRTIHRILEQASLNSIINAGGIFNNYQAIPLSQGYGTHFANVWVGTPTPQRKTVIVDTGSHYTAFPCTGCIKCGAPHHTDPYFRPENSKTFQQLQCNECQDGVVCENSKW
jgi:Xylanase inhibitor N-terminal